MINVKIFVDQLSESEQIILWSPMAPMFVKIETHKTIKDELCKNIKLTWKIMKIKAFCKKHLLNTFFAIGYKIPMDTEIKYTGGKNKKRKRNFAFYINFNLTR